MAFVDGDYKFLWMDVGSDGSSDDASIYNGSELKEGLENPNNPFHLPEDKPLHGDDFHVPYFIIGIQTYKFKVLLTTMNQRPKTCRTIIATCVILHNLIRPATQTT